MKLPRLPWPLLVILLGVGTTLLPPRAPGNFAVREFGALPVLVQGRVKPFDTTARAALLALQGRQRVVTPAGRTLTPIEWLLEVCFRPESADELRTFEIVHPQVLAALDLREADGDHGKRFSLRQLRPGLRELDRQARLADAAAAPERSVFQRELVRLRNNVALYQRLQSSFLPPGVDDFFARLLAPSDTAPAPRLTVPRDELERWSAALEAWSWLRPIPAAAGGAERWRGLGPALQATPAGQPFDEPLLQYLRLGYAWRMQDAAAFNAATAALQSHLAQVEPGAVRRGGLECRFNAARPFITSLVLYLLAFLVAATTWLRASEALRRLAFQLVATGFVLTTAGIALRMWLDGRPPVTNLYSSALFVGWGAVGLCLVLERMFRNTLGAAAAGLIGFAALLVAHHLSVAGDTLEVMRAVLDSNFWLATHVVAITVGYSATFLAGALALLYVLRGTLSRSLDRATADALQRMVYGVICFATFFSLVGTILGGIWADQSWGRFWGWDPKENGALMIVLWNALILHARWSGVARERGVMALALCGNIVTAWSWFGVNMLGVGLHSYGFMDAAFWWLVAFALSQLVAIGLALLPPGRWRSARALG